MEDFARAAREVLVVDDDPDIVDAIALLLEETGYQVTGAADGQAALALLEGGYRPALMVVDYGMPEMTGVELLRVCASRPPLAGIPALLMSAFRPHELEGGEGVSHLRKPFGIDDLLARVAHLLASSASQRSSSRDRTR
jgi:CheY-like chemotaxis protein